MDSASGLPKREEVSRITRSLYTHFRSAESAIGL